MVTSRALGAEIAKIFGLTESAGFNLVWEAQKLGLIPKGSGGGFGALDATSADAALLLLAFAFYADRPKSALEGAAAAFCAEGATGDGQSCNRVFYFAHDNEPVATAGRLFPLPTLPTFFGEHLAVAILGARNGALPGHMLPASIGIGNYRKTEHCSLIVRSPTVQLCDGLRAHQEIYYAQHLPPSSWRDPVTEENHTQYPGSLLMRVAEILGPLARDDRDTVTAPNAERGVIQFNAADVDSHRALFMPDAASLDEPRAADGALLPAGFVLDTAGAEAR